MAVLEQVRDAMFLRRDREFGTWPDDLEIGGLELDSAGGARVSTYAARHLNRGLLSKFLDRLPDVRRQIFLGEHRLPKTAAIAHPDVRDLRPRPGPRDPRAERDGFSR